MRRTLIVLALVGAVAVVAVGPGVAATAIKPSTGAYQGTANNIPAPGGHNEGEGYFRVRAKGKGRIIVPVSPPCLPNLCIDHILAPTDFLCKAGVPTASNIPKANSIPIKAGAFNYSGPPTGTPGRHLHFAGHWINTTHLVGFTKTTGGGCNHTVHWKMKKPPP
jgi:hypothetical protein